MSQVFEFINTTFDNAREFVRSLIAFKTQQRVQNPEILRNEIRRREEIEVRRQEEERRQRARTFADAAEKRLAKKKANETLLDALRSNKRFQRDDKTDEEDDLEHVREMRRKQVTEMESRRQARRKNPHY